jgi:hypothetical protein
MLPYSSPPIHIVFIHTGKGEGGGELTREKVRGEIVHNGRNYTNMTDLSPVYKLF